jgi:hypothetical protein
MNTGIGTMGRVSRKIDYWIKSSRAYNREAWREGAARHQVRESRFHVEEAVGWLKRAHDAAPDKGVARGYSVGWDPYFMSKGWQPSYPETTGYIIPTIFDCARYLGDMEYRRYHLSSARAK